MSSPNVGRFVWYEHLSQDPEAAIAFYTQVVGWKTQPFGGGYTMWVGSQGPLGGVTKFPEAVGKAVVPRWMASVRVDDVDASVALAKQLGATVHVPPGDIPNVGRFCVILDPQGAAIDLFATSSAMPLHDDSKPGEFCWNELYTSDQGAAFAFYSKLFGWQKMSEMDMGAMGTYLIFGVGEKQLGGMMKQPQAGMPPTWSYYIEVPDLEAAIGRATGLGAKVLNGPMPVPGGRIAQLTDPQGTFFALHKRA